MTSATRIEGLLRLQAFLPHAGRAYASLRNYDLPDEGHPHVSRLSPYIRHRLITEDEVIQSTLARHSPKSAEIFLQEVYWRTYWKGWLEMCPSVWRDYQSGVSAAWNRVQSESGLRRAWESACRGETGIDGFDAWAQELTATGYLHNHARMWFASIWIFTLRLPWELGADFFLRHLLDGCPASNTLGWRWVAGIQTPGKTNLARSSNIAKYTKGRVRTDHQLANDAPPLPAPAPPERQPIATSGAWERSARTGLLLHEDDLSPGFLMADGLTPISATALLSTKGRSPLAVSDQVSEFTHNAARDALSRLAPTCDMQNSTEDIRTILSWAQTHKLTQIVAPHAPIGPAAARLAGLRTRLAADDIPLITVIRPSDARAWPHATHGFFRFKDKIPGLIAALGDVRPVGA